MDKEVLFIYKERERNINTNKMNELLVHTTTWVDFKNTLSERSQTKRNVLYNSMYMKYKIERTNSWCYKLKSG